MINLFTWTKCAGFLRRIIDKQLNASLRSAAGLRDLDWRMKEYASAGMGRVSSCHAPFGWGVHPWHPVTLSSSISAQAASMVSLWVPLKFFSKNSNTSEVLVLNSQGGGGGGAIARVVSLLIPPTAKKLTRGNSRISFCYARNLETMALELRE